MSSLPEIGHVLLGDGAALALCSLPAPAPGSHSATPDYTLLSLPAPAHIAKCGALNHSGAVVAAAASNAAGAVVLLAHASGQTLPELCAGAPVEAVAFSASSRWLAAATAKQLLVWDLKTKSTAPAWAAPLPATPAGPGAISFDARAESVFVVCRQGKVCLASVRGGPSAPSATLPATFQPVKAAAFIPSRCPGLEAALITVEANGGVTLWDTYSSPWKLAWVAPTSASHSADHSVLLATPPPATSAPKPAGKPGADPEHMRFVTAGTSGALRIFDAAARTYLGSVQLPSHITALAMLPAGTHAVAGDATGAVHVVDIQEKQLVYSSAVLSAPVRQISPSRKPFSLASSSPTSSQISVSSAGHHRPPPAAASAVAPASTPGSPAAGCATLKFAASESLSRTSASSSAAPGPKQSPSSVSSGQPGISAVPATAAAAAAPATSAPLPASDYATSSQLRTAVTDIGVRIDEASAAVVDAVSTSQPRVSSIADAVATQLAPMIQAALAPLAKSQAKLTDDVAALQRSMVGLHSEVRKIDAALNAAQGKQQRGETAGGSQLASAVSAALQTPLAELSSAVQAAHIEVVRQGADITRTLQALAEPAHAAQ